MRDGDVADRQTAPSGFCGDREAKATAESPPDEGGEFSLKVCLTAGRESNDQGAKRGGEKRAGRMIRKTGLTASLAGAGGNGGGGHQPPRPPIPGPRPLAGYAGGVEIMERIGDVLFWVGAALALLALLRLLRSGE